MERKDQFQERIVRLEEVLHRTGHCRSTVYEEMRTGNFPQSIRIGRRSVGWLDSEITAYIADRVKQSRG